MYRTWVHYAETIILESDFSQYTMYPILFSCEFWVEMWPMSFSSITLEVGPLPKSDLILDYGRLIVKGKNSCLPTALTWVSPPAGTSETRQHCLPVLRCAMTVLYQVSTISELWDFAYQIFTRHASLPGETEVRLSSVSPGNSSFFLSVAFFSSLSYVSVASICAITE